MIWINVTWQGGPHDGERGRVGPPDDLPTARVCECHGALYIAERGGEGWVLNYAERWVAEPSEKLAAMREP